MDSVTLVPYHFCSHHSLELLSCPLAALAMVVACCRCPPAAAFVTAAVPLTSWYSRFILLMIRIKNRQKETTQENLPIELNVTKPGATQEGVSRLAEKVS